MPHYRTAPESGEPAAEQMLINNYFFLLNERFYCFADALFVPGNKAGETADYMERGREGTVTEFSAQYKRGLFFGKTARVAFNEF